MATLSTPTMSGELSDETIQAFKGSQRGAVLRPGDAGYDAARTVYNAMIDKRPALIARCTGVADVIGLSPSPAPTSCSSPCAAVATTSRGTPSATGASSSTCPGMRSIRVDPVRRTVRAEPGVTYREFDRETQAFGLATPGGTISATGIAGLTLGGGFGWLSRQHGLACDNLLSVDMVLADGRFVTASAEEHADLFWGVRGGGGNFGVVTSFEYRLHPVGPVLGGLLVHPLPRAREALRFYREFTATAPDELSVFAALLTNPDGSQVVAFVVCYNGPIERGEEVIRPLRQFGPPVADLVQPIPYTAMQTLMDDGFPNGLQNYWKSSFLQEISDEAIDTIIAQFQAAPSPLCALVIEQFGGAGARVGRGETAFSHRDGHSNLAIIARCADPADTPRTMAWAREAWAAMQPFADGGAYSNYAEAGEEGAARITAAYRPETYERLVALKNTYDPTNFFRVNQNIAPTV